MVVAPVGEEERAVIELRRRDGGGVLRIGHRGAAHIAPENTIDSLRAAVAHGVDLVEFDVLDLRRGPLVLAHSDHLDEVSHGRATGSVRERTLAELREVAPDLPTLDEALEWLAAREIVLHVDLKLSTRLDELAHALERHGVVERTVVSGFEVPALLEVARRAPRLAIGRTYPMDRHGVSKRRALRPVIRAGSVALRASLARRVPAMIERAGAVALMLHHAVVSPAAVERAHERGVAVWAWTVDDPAEAERVIRVGADAVITNDPAKLAATLRP
jgi:glycerophosphoryl diester phosphodiesterase